MNFLEALLSIGIVMDAPLVLSSAQAQTSVASHDSTDKLNFGAADPNIGVGSPLWLAVVVQTTCAGASGSTLQVKVQDAADGSTYTTLFETSIGTAAGFAGAATSIFSIAAGTTLINQPLPAKIRQYLKVVYVIGTTVLSAGAWDAYLHKGGVQP